MTNPLTPQQIQELAAGYVLGDLDPQESDLFQHLLQTTPALAIDVQQLQEALNYLPYALAEPQPPPQLRANILTEAHPIHHRSHMAHRWPQWQLRGWQLGSSLVALLVLVLGVHNLHLRQQLALRPPSLPATSQAPITRRDGIGTVVATSEPFLTRNWEGMSELVADHTRSLSRRQGPVDFPTADVIQIQDQFQDQMPRSAPLPQLIQEGVKLLGGSFCNLNATQGIRMTYQIQSGQTASLYQLAPAAPGTFPHGSARLYVQVDQGPSLVLWRDHQWIYVLVADLAMDEMQQLTRTIASI